jgi:hypothetical protein
MTRDLIYEDESGNKLMKDLDNRLIVLNQYNKIVEPNDARRFISRPSVRIAMKRYFGDIPQIKILNARQTFNLRKKVKGGMY